VNITKENLTIGSVYHSHARSRVAPVQSIAPVAGVDGGLGTRVASSHHRQHLDDIPQARSMADRDDKEKHRSSSGRSHHESHHESHMSYKSAKSHASHSSDSTAKPKSKAHSGSRSRVSTTTIKVIPADPPRSQASQASRNPTVVRARNVPLPESVVGSSADSVAPSDSISCVGSSSSRRRERRRG